MTRYTDAVRYVPIVLGKDVIRLTAQPLWVPTPSPRNPIWRRIHEVFNVEHFLYPAAGVDLGPVDVPLAALQGVRSLRCPIKRAGELELLLPAELAALEPLVRHALETEVHVNPRFADFFAHLSFECTELSPGATQRVPGWHVDGFQGVRSPPHQVEHSYLWASAPAVQFCVQPFFLQHLDRARHNVFDEVTRQARAENALAGLDSHVYLIDPYVVHRSPVVEKAGWRAFARITFESEQLADPVNTVNLSLRTPAPSPRMDARNRFWPYKADVPWEGYGLKGRA